MQKKFTKAERVQKYTLIPKEKFRRALLIDALSAYLKTRQSFQTLSLQWDSQTGSQQRAVIESKPRIYTERLFIVLTRDPKLPNEFCIKFMSSSQKNGFDLVGLDAL